MRIESIMNQTQKQFKNENIDQKLAMHQHTGLTDTLRDYHIEVIELPVTPKLNEQVFTRDIGFTIGSELFVATMKEPLRKSETHPLMNWCEQQSIPYHELTSGTIEGGDVIVDDYTIWVGESGRTSIEAIEELRERLPSFEIHPIQLEENILHLDCAFNPISDQAALIYPPAFTPRDFTRLQERFDFITVTDEEYFTLGPNVLSIGDGTIISLKQNERLNHLMEERGFNVIGIDFSEIIKSGGSFRCCTLPIYRA
ncbi:hypothetical protein H0266_11070 [Halobacillus locisalis]|uniref:N-Dimethylarginine dimethylaminohydrolase n=2 Tax=Halobacillus locisalis TaxID=220753 RepID=A0A838CUZ6_9BACI|nr:hypothetical protein [Halobacillus locisalis]